MGNCLFESLNVYIKCASALELRKQICRFISENPHVFEKDILADQYTSVTNYVRTMEIEWIDGDHVCMCAACLLFDVKIHVLMPNGRVFTIENPLKETLDTKTIHLKWTRGHYSVQKSFHEKHKRHLTP